MVKKILLLLAILWLAPSFAMQISIGALLEDHPLWHQTIRAKEAEILRAVETSTYHMSVGRESFYVKEGVSRVSNAQKMRNFCEEKGLDLIYIPQKYLYHIKGKPYDVADANYLVLAEEVPVIPGCEQRITLDQVNQLFAVLERFGYQDINPGNIVFIIMDGIVKLAIIDTESSAFESLSQEQVIDSLLRYFKFEDDALEHLIGCVSSLGSQFSNTQSSGFASIGS